MSSARRRPAGSPAVVDQQVAASGASGAVCAVDDGAVWVLLRGHGVLSGRHQVPRVVVVATAATQADHAFGLEGVALERHLLHDPPLRGTTERPAPTSSLLLFMGKGLE
ncbi:hypothetical protein PG997_005856 [Apiospora hydei]|uniref:Uncharacterized protein n=1 Tax=Apiospora hydei TaxID=1337664 RepID=A0ABR1WM35_9PEZI